MIFSPRFFQILGAHEPAQPVLDRRIIIEDIVDKIVGAAPDRDGFDALFRRGRARAGVTAHAGAMQADALGVDVGAGDEIIDHRFGDALGVGRRVEFLVAQACRHGRGRRRR